jgi:hypothetical protein
VPEIAGISDVERSRPLLTVRTSVEFPDLEGKTEEKKKRKRNNNNNNYTLKRRSNNVEIKRKLENKQNIKREKEGLVFLKVPLQSKPIVSLWLSN